MVSSVQTSLTRRPTILQQVAAGLLLALMAFPAQAATMRRPPPPPPGPREIVVENKADAGIAELYVAEASSGSWGDDQLNNTLIEPGGAVRLRLGRQVACSFDIEVVYADGRSEDALDVDVCHTARISFAATNAVSPRIAGEPHSFRLSNLESRPIALAFVSGSAADAWGDDRLAGTPMPAGNSRDISFHGDCKIDLRVVFDNRSAEERRDIDICAAPVVEIKPGWTTAEPPPPTLAAQTPPAH